MRLAITPTLMILSAQLGIGLCLFLLWLPERGRRELLYFTVFLLAHSCAMSEGIRSVYASGSFWWHLWFYRPLASVGFLFLYLFAAAIFRLRPPPPYLVFGAGVVSLLFITQAVGSGFYLLPWLAVIAWECVRAIQFSPRGSLPFAVAILLFVAGVLNNIAPPGLRLPS